MSRILVHLYVAGVDETFQDETLMKSVTHFLNVADELELLPRVDHGYKKIAIQDDNDECDIRDILDDCIQWIHDMIMSGGTVCVHCLEGKSRSVCVCLAYLCCKLQWNFDYAYQWIKKQRPIIDIFPLYLEQVKLYINNYLET